MSEGTWKLFEERRELKARIESAKTRRQKLTSTCLYHTKNREAKRSCWRDKRARMDSIALEAEEAAEKKGMKKVYDTTWLLSRKRNIQSKPVKDRNGEVLTKIEDQLNRWKEYFQKFLNRPVPENPTDLPKGHCTAGC